jgi:hypothetical protein
MKKIAILILFCLPGIVCLAQKKRRTGSNTSYTRSAGMTFSLPWTNAYALHNYETGQPDTKAGFFGIGLSFYYKKDNHKYSLNTGFTGDLPAPMGPIDFGKEGTRYTIKSGFVEMNFHQALWKRLGVIGGVNYVNYQYYFIDYDNEIQFTKHDPTMGLTTGLEYISRKSFALALFYRPSLVSFRTKQYYHLISLDVRFDFAAWKK